MAEIVITLPGYRCERCGHQWVARHPRGMPDADPRPRICPKCKSARWDSPRPIPKAQRVARG